MLIDKSEELYQKAQEAINLRSYAEQLAGFQTRETEIQEAVAKLSSLMEALKPFRDRALITLESTQEIQNFLQFVSQAETNFQNNPAWLLDSNNFKGKQFKSGVDKIVKTYERKLSQAWKDYLNQNMPSTNPEFLSLLKQVPDFKQIVEKIEAFKQRIPQDDYPRKEEEFRKIEGLIESLKSTWASLSAENVPDSVLQFLRAAANQGASLDLLTPEVQAWIEEHGISDSLRIRLI